MERLTTDDLRRRRLQAAQQRRVCLPLDRAGWDRQYRAATAELERRGITCHGYTKRQLTAITAA